MSQPEPRWDQHELIPAIVQDVNTRQVLMIAYMNHESYALTLRERTGLVLEPQPPGALAQGRHQRSLSERPGRSAWTVTAMRSCSRSSLTNRPATPTRRAASATVVRPAPAGPTAAETAAELWDVVNQRLAERPEGSYVAKLAAGGVDRFAKKVGEEATEVVIAAKNNDNDELTREMADLWFHCYLLLAQAGLPPEAVWAELARRRRYGCQRPDLVAHKSAPYRAEKSAPYPSMGGAFRR